MYLVDAEIRKRLSDLRIEAPNPDHPFDLATQIQPCSIDLRIDNRVWYAGKSGTIDLRRSFADKIHPHRGWRSKTVDDHDVIVIKPGMTIFARVYERFTMPSDLAGKIEGRSSFARFGLSVHCTSDFINPGWNGNMPLQLFNAGPHAIRVPPFIPICQLMLLPLNASPDRIYGAEGLDSKYQNDDGGPSFWWRDRRIKALHERLEARSLPLAIEKKIAALTEGREVEIIDRFEAFVEKLEVRNTYDADGVIDRFAKSEQRRKRARRAVEGVFSFVTLTLLAVIASTAFGSGFDFAAAITWILFGSTGAAGAISLWTLLRAKTGYLLPENVETLRRAALPRPSQSEAPTLPPAPPVE